MRVMILLVATQGKSISDLLLALLKSPLVWVTALTTFAIPFLNAAVTKVSTHPLAKSAVSAVLAGVLALVAWLTGLSTNEVDWKTAIVIFVAALAGAGGINAAFVKGTIADWLHVKVPIGIGPVMTPEKAAAKHSNSVDLTQPVPASPVPSTAVPASEIPGLPAEYTTNA